MVGIFHVFCFMLNVCMYRIVAHTFICSLSVVLSLSLLLLTEYYHTFHFALICKLLLACQVVPASKGLQIYYIAYEVNSN